MESLKESEKALGYYEILEIMEGLAKKDPADRLAERPGSEPEQRGQNIRKSGKARRFRVLYEILEIMEGLKKDHGRTDCETWE